MPAAYFQSNKRTSETQILVSLCRGVPPEKVEVWMMGRGRQQMNAVIGRAFPPPCIHADVFCSAAVVLIPSKALDWMSGRHAAGAGR
jgi:hypothetical protein